MFGVFLFTDSAGNAEIVARSGVDWLLIDLEHGAATETTLLPMLLAAKGSAASPLVRVESGARIRVGRALDLGAEGVMVPQVASVEDARAAARWMRTQPVGERGIALFTRGMDFGSGGHASVAGRHESLLSIVQIESRGALGDVEAIAAVEGIDVLFVGPTDLTHALSIPGQVAHPDYDAAIRRVGAAAQGAGKAAGVLLWDPADVGRYGPLGFTFFGLSSEAMILDRAVRASLERARQARETAGAGRSA